MNFIYLGFWVTTNHAQVSFVALCSEITPDGAGTIICDVEDLCGFGNNQDNHLTSCPFSQTLSNEF